VKAAPRRSGNRPSDSDTEFIKRKINNNNIRDTRWKWIEIRVRGKREGSGRANEVALELDAAR